MRIGVLLLSICGLASLASCRASSVVQSGSGSQGASAQREKSAEQRCAAEGLVYNTAFKTSYESYPDPGSVECVEYNGCKWEGQFAGCAEKQTKEWVAAHNIASLFPHFQDYALHELCLRSGEKTMVVTVYDTCADSDCDGCCTRNRGQADALIDLESATNERWGLPDGPIEWADLGRAKEPACQEQER